MCTHYLVIAELQFEALILDIIVDFVEGVGGLALLVGPIAINQHLVACVEEDTCTSYEEEDTCMLCMLFEEEDTCMSYQDEDICMGHEA